VDGRRPAVYDVFADLIIDDTIDDPDAIVPATDYRPNEVGGVTDADTYPVATVGKSRSDLDAGEQTRIVDVAARNPRASP